MKLSSIAIGLSCLLTAISVSANQTCEEPYRSALPAYTYTLNNVLEVNGRQGITTDGKYLYVSGSKTLAKYDMQGKLIAENKDPFVGYQKRPTILAISIFITMNCMFPPNGLKMA